MTTVFGDLLRQHSQAERVTDPANETFVTLRLNGKGATKRNVGEGKTPQPFSGYRVRTGQFIYSRIDARNGAFAIISSNLDGAVVSKDFPVFDIDRSLVDPKFLLLSVSNESFIDRIRRLSFGATNRQRVKEEIFLNLPIELPPLDEQRRIAAILDKADELRTKRREALAHLDTLTQSIFHSMFGSVSRPHANIPLVPIDSLCRLVRGSSPRPQGDPRYFGGPVPRLMIADITRDGDWVTPQIDSLTVAGAGKSRPVPAGTVVMAVSGNIGLAAILAVDACIHDGFVGFTQLDATQIEARFLQTVLKVGRSLHDSGVAGAIFKNITTTDIKKTKIPLPPPKLQRTFATRVAAVERLKELHRKHLAELDALFASLQHRAFKGEL